MQVVPVAEFAHVQVQSALVVRSLWVLYTYIYTERERETDRQTHTRTHTHQAHGGADGRHECVLYRMCSL